MARISIATILLVAAAAGVGVQGRQAGTASITVPAGQTINVRLTQAIDVDVAQVGMTFKARVDDPVTVDGRVAIPREAGAVLQAVKVVQSDKLEGSDKISLKLNTVSFGGHTYQVASEYAMVKGKGEGKRTARKVGGGAGLGALFGGIVGGGEGALVGAVVGGITGTVVAAQGEEHLRLEAESRLQFTLASSVRVRP
jgi:hypothetical protein